MNNIYAFWVSNEYYVKNWEFSDIAWECYQLLTLGNIIEKLTIEVLIRRKNIQDLLLKFY